jgi:hypothetical protein
MTHIRAAKLATRTTSDATTGWRARQILARLRSLPGWEVRTDRLRLEVEESLAESVFVLLLGFLGFFAGVFFVEAGCLPGVYLCLGVVSGGESFFFAYGGDPAIHRGLVGGLELVKI